MILTITVPSGLARLADDLGTRLAEFRENRGSVHTNQLTTTFDRRLEMNILGTRAEAALYWFLGGFWGGAKWDTTVSNDRAWGKMPDIIFRGENYDAKGIDRNNLSLVVYPKGLHSAWRYVLVGTQFWPDAEFLGWCSGEDISALVPTEKVPGRPAYFVKQDSEIMRSCLELPVATPEERMEAFFAYPVPQDQS